MTIFGVKINAYLICVASGAAAAGLLFLFNFYFFQKRYKIAVKRCFLLFAITGFCAAGGVALSFLSHFFFVKNFWEYPVYYALNVTGPQYFTTLTYFLPLFYFALKIFKFHSPLEGRPVRGVVAFFNLVLPSLVLFSAVARIGCMFGGCCGGITINGFAVPAREFEFIFALTALFIICYFQYKNRNVNLFEKENGDIKFNYALKYYYIYAIYRFFTDFLKDKEHMILVFNIFDVAQFLALIAIIYLTVNVVLPYFKKRKNPPLNQ